MPKAPTSTSHAPAGLDDDRIGSVGSVSAAPGRVRTGGAPGSGDGRAPSRGGSSGRSRRSWRPAEVHRVGELDQGRSIAFWLVIAALASLPVISAVVVLRQGWTPTGDNALIGLRVSDVLHGKWPLLGQPTTGENFGSGIQTNHPGPIEFYLIAPFVLVLGSAWGLAVGAAAINGAAMAATAWVAFRRGGLELMALTGVLVLALSRSLGGNFLHDPVSSQVGAMASIVVLYSAWSILAGDLRVIPVFFISATFALQDHLAYFGTTGLVVGMAVAGGLGWWWHAERMERAERAGRGAARSGDPDDRDAVPVRPIAIWAGVSALLWLPVLLDEFGGAGNLGAVWRTFSGKRTASEGWDFALQRLAWAVGPWPIIARVVRPLQQLTPPSSAGNLAAIVVAGSILALTAVAWSRRRTDLVALAAVTLGAAAAGTFTANKLPVGAGIQPSNLRWMWTASLIVWVTALWQAWTLLRRPLRTRIRPALAVLSVVLVLALWVATVGSVSLNDDRDGTLARSMPAFRTAVIAGVPEGRYRVAYKGDSVVGSVGPALVHDLDRRGGYSMFVDAGPFTRAYAKHRRFDDQAVDGTLILSSERGGIPSDAEFITSLRFLADPHSDKAGQMLEVRVFLSPDGHAVIR